MIFESALYSKLTSMDGCFSFKLLLGVSVEERPVTGKCGKFKICKDQSKSRSFGCESLNRSCLIPSRNGTSNSSVHFF